MLRSRRLAGLKFRRKVPFGNYILDFYCADLKIALEITPSEGSTGSRAARDMWLLSKGVRLVRINASDVLSEPTKVLDSIHKAIAAGQVTADA